MNRHYLHHQYRQFGFATLGFSALFCAFWLLDLGSAMLILAACCGAFTGICCVVTGILHNIAVGIASLREDKGETRNFENV